MPSTKPKPAPQETPLFRVWLYVETTLHGEQIASDDFTPIGPEYLDRESALATLNAIIRRAKEPRE